MIITVIMLAANIVSFKDADKIKSWDAWDGAKTEQEKGVYDFSWLDPHIRECAAFGLDGVATWTEMITGRVFEVDDMASVPLWDSPIMISRRFAGSSAFEQDESTSARTMGK